jgi:uncharacterized protein (DUF2249 family)
VIGGCSYLANDYCKKLKKLCEPVTKWCVLYGQGIYLASKEGHGNMNHKIETLDLLSTPPSDRPEKIFQIWNTLKPGEILRIIVDHDPKPLHDHFEKVQKGKYEWQYEQKGPWPWIVKIKRI